MKKLRKASVLIIAVIAVAVLASCIGKSRLVGTWSNSETVLGATVETSYTFQKDGTGKMSTLLGLTYDFTYDVSDGKLYITYTVAGTETTTVYEYEISGNILYLTSDGNTIKLTKQ